MATAFFGGAFFGGEFFSTSAAVTPADVGGGHGKPWQQKWRQELIDLLNQPEPEIKLPAKAKKAITRVLEAAPEDDAEARSLLRESLAALNVRIKPKYYDALRFELGKLFQAQMRHELRMREMERDEEEVLLLLLH